MLPLVRGLIIDKSGILYSPAESSPILRRQGRVDWTYLSRYHEAHNEDVVVVDGKSSALICNAVLHFGLR